jgi:HIRAN domain
MFSRMRRRTVEWRRVAQFEPICVEGALLVEYDGTDRPSDGTAPQVGMRVVLAREPDNEHDRNAVAVDSLGEQRLGYLPAEVADWIAPLLDSGRVAFDGRIFAIGPTNRDSATGGAFFLTLTQFEFRPVERFSLGLSIRSLLHVPAIGVNWCIGQLAALYHAFSQTSIPPSDR